MTDKQIGRIASNFIARSMKKGQTHCKGCIMLNASGLAAARTIIAQLGGRERVEAAARKLNEDGDGNNMYSLFAILKEEGE